MKIHKHNAKRVAATHPELAKIIKTAVEIPQDELPGFLATIPTWKWPRSDLHSWVKVLNHFDGILKDFIAQYELETLQVNPFTPLTKATILEILRFETMLLENSTNRKLFSSYDRLNSLLFTTDLDVLIGALQLLLRPSQQYSSQPSVSHTLHVSTKRLLALARRWPGIREHGIEFVDLFDKAKSDTLQIPVEAGQVVFRFYKKEVSTKAAEKTAELVTPTPTPTATPAKARASASSVTPTALAASPSSAQAAAASGMVTIFIPSLISSDKSAMETLAPLVEKHAIPSDDKFELLCRIRSARSLGREPERQDEREKLCIIRLLSLAIFAHTLSEQEAQSSVFIYEPDLITHLAELMHPDRSVPVNIQTAAIVALDGIARYRSKTGEVLAAVNAGVTHGILMSVLRKTVTSLADPNSPMTSEFPEALISFVVFLSSSPSGGGMIVGAGLVPLLIQLLQNRLPSRLQIVSKTTSLIDNALYGFGNAFQTFCTLHGVDVLLARIQHEVDINVEESTTHEVPRYAAGSQGRLPFPRSLALKHILRTMHRMMQTSGTSESLRGLIDSTLPKSIKKILEYRGLFGPAIFALAINLMASFVHNEPTSLTILQEAGLPAAFYNAIDEGIESAIEVITAIPSAIGALCLNQAGLDQLEARPSILKRIFSILTSERHIKTLHDKENASYIGASIDELVRHHPSLKTPVFEAIEETLQRIEDLGQNFVVPATEAASYNLLLVSDPDIKANEDYPMERADPVIPELQPEVTRVPEPTLSAPAQFDNDAGSALPDDVDSQALDGSKNLILSYIQIIGRFLDGLFQNTAHSREFINKCDGVERICRLFSLPCLPFDSASSGAALSLVGVLKTMADAMPQVTLLQVAQQVKKTLDGTKELWTTTAVGKSTLMGWTNITTSTDLAATNSNFRKLVTLHFHVYVLAQIYATAGYAQGRVASTILQTINGVEGPNIISDLGALYRGFLWESIILNLQGSPSPSDVSEASGVLELQVSDPQPAGTSAEIDTDGTLAPLAGSSETPAHTKSTLPPQEQNLKTVRALAQNLSKATTPFFQAVVKLFLYNRRNPDPAQRQQAASTAKLISGILLDHLKWDTTAEHHVASRAYSTMIIGLIAVLLFDERTSQNSLHTLLLFTFQRSGGLDEIIRISRSYSASLERISSIDASDRTSDDESELAAATNGLGVVLHLCQPLLSSRPLFESGQTAMLIMRDKPKTDPEHFDPHNFLIELRTALFPLFSEYWQASWVETTSFEIAKLVVQGFLETMSADNEVSPPTGGQDNISATLTAQRRAPDENHIRQLCDMGFPRTAAERALLRTQNNLAAAAEYLLLHPFALVSHPEAPVPEEPVPEEHPAPSESAAEGAADNTPSTNEPTPMAGENDGIDVTMADAAVAEIPDKGKGKEDSPPSTPAELKTRLDDLRLAVIAGVASRVMALLDHHQQLVFDVKRAFLGSSDKYQASTFPALYAEIIAAVKNKSLPEDVLAVRLRLFALVLSDIRPSESAKEYAESVTLMDSFVDLIRSPGLFDNTSSQSPQWLTPVLLVMENIFIIGEEPIPVTVPKDEDPISLGPIQVKHLHPEARAVTFDFALRALGIKELPRNELIAILRLLVLLTRDHGVATAFVNRGGLPLLLTRFNSGTKEARGCQVHVLLILRHVIEDPSVLDTIMKQDVLRWLSQPRSLASDVSAFMKSCSHAVLRDPNVFIESCKALCALAPAASGGYYITLKEDVKALDEGKKPLEPPVVNLPSEGVATDMQIDDPPAPPLAVESLDTLLRYLIGELIRVGKSAMSAAMMASDGAANEAGLVNTQDGTGPKNTPIDQEGVADYLYACFLLQTLTELLSAYNSCKLAFITHARKRSATPSKDPSKHRVALLQFLLSEMVSFGDINLHPPPIEIQRRMLLSNWAISVIVALCADSSWTPDLRDLPADLSSVRKLVLDSVAKAIREANPSESVDARYGRLYALGDLVYRLLTFRPALPPGVKSSGDSNLHIAKLMLEKNFVSILTSTLGELDLNYPNVKLLVSTILRPLEHLSKIAIKMGKAPERSRAASIQDDESVSSSISTDDAEEISEAEETPDLYRNSALGMYGGEMEDMSYPNEDDMDEDDEDDEDVEMEYGDEDMDTDHTSETSQEDEDEEHDDIQVGNELPDGSTWQDGVDEDGSEEGSSVGGDDAEEIAWEDDPNEGIDDGLEELAELHDEGGLGGDDDEGDEEGDGDSPSDDDDVAHRELGALDLQLAEQVADFNEFGEGIHHHHHHHHHIPTMDVFAPTGTARRGGAEQYLQVFGRSRQVPRPASDAITHPLMTENRAPSAPTAIPHPHRSRQLRVSRGTALPSGQGFTGLLSMIQDLIGEDGQVLIEQLVQPGGNGEAILELTTEGSAPIQIARIINSRGNHPHPSQSQGDTDDHQRDFTRDAQEFIPAATQQRWADESKMTQGKAINERLTSLANYVILALLPEAREREKARAQREEDAVRLIEKARELAASAPSEPIEPAESTHPIQPPEPSVIPNEPAEIVEPTGEPISPDVQMEAPAAVEEPTPVSSMPIDEPEDLATSAAPEVSPEEGASTTPPPPPATNIEMAADAPDETEAGPSVPAPRVTVMINGESVDITDTGIDPTFLEALPDDMREEILNQHFRDRRAAQHTEAAHESQISQEFLDALPPEIRTELLQQEQDGIERARRERERAAAADAAPAGPAEIDPASFLASLEPALRQAVLMDQEQDFLQSLPPQLLAEANAILEGDVPPRRVAGRTHPSSANPPSATRKMPVQRDAIQLLDRTGVATLARLLFFPEVLKKNSLHKVLGHLCENSRTRIDLFNLLLGILQDGSGDLAFVDKSFSQLSFRPPKTQGTPSKSISKQKSIDPQQPNTSSPGITDSLPDLVAQRCLEALTFIVSANDSSASYFLSEQEVSASLRKPPSRKGKGKEKAILQTHYPVVLLLSLLDRDALLRSPPMMESVAALLAHITRPLGALKDPAPKSNDVTPTVPIDDTHVSAPPPSSETQGVSEIGIIEPPADTQPPGDIAPLVTLSKTDDMHQKLRASPPQIPPTMLRLIVNLLTAGECSGRTFHSTLSLIQHLTWLPGARDVIAAELKSKAEEFGQSLYHDLDELTRVLHVTPAGSTIPSSAVSKFSPASADQAKLLRILKTLDYMFTPKPSTSPAGEGATPEPTPESDHGKVHEIYESFHFGPLWRRLGDSLSAVESKSDFDHVATVLLPLIESLMVVCKYVGTKPNVPRILAGSASPRSPISPRESAEDLFVAFTDAHRKVLNLMVRNNPSLMSGSFSLLVHNPRVLDFDNKRNYFSQQLRRRTTQSRENYATLQLNVRRPHVFEDSYQYLQRKTGEQIKYGKLSVRFYDEEGVDAGGVTREWFQILARQMFNPDYALFQPCAADKLTYQPNRASAVNPEHLSFFKFVGRVIGKAIYDGRLLDAYFARSLYRQILGKPVDYRDVEWVDPEYYKSLCWILENDPSVLDMNFTVEADEFGLRKIVELKEGGANIAVTQESKREFVQLSAQYRLISSIKDQIDALLGGFYEIIPKELVAIFNEQEVELLISGTPDIDIDEWRAATDYHGYNQTDPVIAWWWRALKSFNRDERAKVLSFATGTSRVPLGGFVELQGVQGVQRFSIHRAYGEPDRLPSAHTCFNQIDVPQFTSYEMLRTQLLTAINEGGEGFGFA